MRFRKLVAVEVTSPGMTGRLFRAMRGDLELTQRELAEKLGIHQVSIARWEVGLVALPLERLIEEASKVGYRIHVGLVRDV